LLETEIVVKRRDLLKRAALGAAALPISTTLGSTLSAQQSQGTPVAPSDRVRVGFIGVGGFGYGTNLPGFMRNADVEVAAVCDVLDANVDRAVTLSGGKARRYKDYRRLLEDKAIDAVVVTTPEHWHAIMTIDACDAGKDVYVEKPCAHHIKDGRLMVEAARRNNRIVQVGTQQRSGAHFQRVAKYVREGRIGDIYYATCWHHSPRSAPVTPVKGGPPAGMDWDLWLGPAPNLPYDEVMNVGRRGSWDFWGGNLTEWGSHLADIVFWAMNVKAPERVAALGGQFHRKQGQIPDTLQISYTYPGFLFHYSILHHNSYGLNGDIGAARFGSYGIQFHGTKGTLFVDRSGFRLTPQPTRQEEPNQPPGPPTTDSRAPGFYYTTEIQPEVSDSSVQHPPHVRNFLDCVKSRKRPIAEIEDAHYTNTALRLGNISYRVGRTLRWDAAREVVVDDAEANALAVGTYRAPWKPRGLTS
jgi:predicted dehydrogenase